METGAVERLAGLAVAMDLQQVLMRLQQRGQLEAIYMDIQRAVEIEKEHCRIQAKINGDGQWKNSLYTFKRTLEVALGMVVEDVFNEVMCKEQKKEVRFCTQERSEFEGSDQNLYKRTQKYFKTSDDEVVDFNSKNIPNFIIKNVYAQKKKPDGKENRESMNFIDQLPSKQKLKEKKYKNSLLNGIKSRSCSRSNRSYSRNSNK